MLYLLLFCHHLTYLFTFLSNLFFLFCFCQVTLKEKDSHIEEIKKLLSEKLEIVTSLEQDLSNCRLELTGRDKRINDFLQAEVH